MSCIFVTGMHRSGTSCLTGIMQSMGIELGEVHTANEHNKKGNRENARINRANDILLGLAGGSWDNPVVINEWNDAARAERDSIIAEIKATASEHWGFKDPRAMFTLPFWLEAEPDLKFLGTYRHPYRTALSLLNRDKTPVAEGLRIWNAYNVRMLELLQIREFDIVNFDLDQQAYLDDAIAKLLKLGIDSSKSEAARSFFDGSLRNQTNEQVDEFELPADIAKTYQRLNEYFATH
jgi:hypothetical protein